jgi:hypothetical protein
MMAKHFIDNTNLLRTKLFIGTVPANKNYVTGTIPANKNYINGTVKLAMLKKYLHRRVPKGVVDVPVQEFCPKLQRKHLGSQHNGAVLRNALPLHC